MNAYYKVLQADAEKAKDYYKKSTVKTEQQKFLEQMLADYPQRTDKLQIADICCGGGTLSYHLSSLFPSATFELVDFNPQAVELAKELNAGNNRFSFSAGNVYDLPQHNRYDLVFCWQSLGWLEKPKEALLSLLKITKPGGKLYISSLFNLDFDCDLYTKVFDNTRQSARDGLYIEYNTISMFSIRKWLKNEAQKVEITEFMPGIDFKYNGRGLGTGTKMCDGKRLQFSGGMLMTWGILVITK